MLNKYIYIMIHYYFKAEETRNESELEGKVLENENERKETEKVRPFKLMYFNNLSIIHPYTMVLRWNNAHILHVCVYKCKVLAS